MNTFREMTPERLDQIIARFAQARIAVIGDFFLDKYLDVDPRLAEKSLETGKTCHQVTRIRHSPGAAGTVVSNFSALGRERFTRSALRATTASRMRCARILRRCAAARTIFSASRTG